MAVIKTRVIQINVQFESRDRFKKPATTLQGKDFTVKHAHFNYLREVLFEVVVTDNKSKCYRIYRSEELELMPQWLKYVEETVVKPELLAKTEKYKPIRKTPDRRKV